MSLPIVTPQSFRDYMRSGEFRQSLQESMARNVDPDRLMRVAVSCISKDTNLQRASLLSLAQCVADAARIGLEPGISVLGHCWMVAYQVKTHDGCDHQKRLFKCEVSGSEAQLQVGYRGKAELFRRAVPGGRIHAREWRQKDLFKPIGGTSPRLIHKWNPNENRGGVVGYYAIAFYPDGFRMFETMSAGEVEEIRQKFSKSKDSPAWTKSFDEMGKAKVTNRLEKWLDLSIEQVTAAELDEENSGLIVPGRKIEDDEGDRDRVGGARALGAEANAMNPGSTSAGQAPSPAALRGGAPTPEITPEPRATIPAGDGAAPTQQAAPAAKPEPPKGKGKSKALEAAQARGGVKASENPPAPKAAPAKPAEPENLPEPPEDWRPDPDALPPGVAAIREQDRARESAEVMQAANVWPYTLPEGLMPSERAAWLAANATPPYGQCNQTGGCVRKAGHAAAECSSKLPKAGT